MDTPLAPPVRIQLLSATPLSSAEAGKDIAKFLEGYAARAESGDVVLGQVEKLAGALQEGR